MPDPTEPTEPAQPAHPAHPAHKVIAFARRAAHRHPAAGLGIAGFLASCLVVVVGARVALPRGVIPLSSWLGLVPARRPGGSVAGALMIVGILALLALWIVALRHRRRVLAGERTVWALSAAWGLPFVIGPPLLSNDVYSYVAQGLMLRQGLDPYASGPDALGNTTAVAAVDPSWRSVASPYGPLASTLQHLAISISGGNPLGAVLVFRAVGVVCLIAIGVLGANLAGSGRVAALAATVLNPLLLLHLVSAAHLDGVMSVLVLGAVYAARRRRWTLAIGLAVAAGAIKAPAFAAVPAVIALHIGSLRGRRLWERAAADSLIALAGAVGLGFVVPNGWGWIHALNSPALGHTALAPASLLSDLIHVVVSAASFDDLDAGGRITALAAAGCIVAYLTLTARHRPLERTIGFGLLAVGILSPVVYPWYLLGGVVALAPTARGRQRDLIVAVSATACLLSPPGFSAHVSTAISAVAALVALGAAFALWLGDIRSAGGSAGGADPDAAGGGPGYRPPEISRTAGRTSAR